MINYLKSMLYTVIFILGSLLIITVLNYFNILNGNTLSIIRSIIPLIGIFIGSFRLGKSSSKKGYIEGLKYSAIWLFIFILFNIVLSNFGIGSIIYYIILILVSVVGSILGINRKKY